LPPTVLPYTTRSHCHCFCLARSCLRACGVVWYGVVWHGVVWCGVVG
jgi:hypothetical protein